MNIDAFSYWNQVSAVAAQFPGAEAGDSYGTPAYKVHKKLFVRLKEDGKTIVVYNNERQLWMQRNPVTFFITDHYKNYPVLLVDLASVKKKDLQTLLRASWQLRAPNHLLKKEGN